MTALAGRRCLLPERGMVLRAERDMCVVVTDSGYERVVDRHRIVLGDWDGLVRCVCGEWRLPSRCRACGCGSYEGVA